MYGEGAHHDAWTPAPWSTTSGSHTEFLKRHTADPWEDANLRSLVQFLKSEHALGAWLA